MDIQQYVNTQQKRIEEFLDKVLPNQTNELHMAMRYAALTGGKRFRPLLVYTVGDTLKADETTLDYVAASVEIVHSYSLVHDDLPAMDDDAMRRGKPSCHKAFNEATAILAGDGLLSFAFELLTQKALQLSAEMKLHLVNHLAKASGSNGMALGQSLDLHPEDITNVESINSIHLHKTGSLIEASVLMGAHAANCTDPEVLRNLQAYAEHLGLAYQIQDDILDLETSAELITESAEGGPVSKDNVSYPVLLGTESAKAEAKRYYDSAFEHLNTINMGNSKLAELTTYMMKRDY